MVDVSEKQILWIKAEVTGKQTHGSTPSKGINAFRVGTQFLADLMSRLSERYPKKDPIFRPEASTFEPTKSSATDCSVNTIPGYYEFYMDCRVLLDYDIDERITWSQAILGASLYVEENTEEKTAEAGGMGFGDDDFEIID